MRKAWVVAIAAVVLLAGAAWFRLRPAPRVPEPLPGRGLAAPYRQLHGRIAAIVDGQLILREVYGYDDRQSPANFQRPEEHVPLPAGHWVSSTHWQSADQSLDLFLGQQYWLPLDHPGQILPDELHRLPCLVRAVHNDTVDCVVYSASPSEWQQVQGEESLKLPSKRAVLDQNGQPLRAGWLEMLLWFGEPGDKIVSQTTHYDHPK